ncbi:hypothetical protein KUV65_09725 [Maritalea mobilis]|uniref:hypothetical protein n=1 Tax=Maritalea mobilis TaxID=483324 RepID=UPI001C959699|nr:hypothetical protein [Maritalea mobilis]MBY6201640.1 hypothetical protein [Maritalea mobilis]
MRRTTFTALAIALAALPAHAARFQFCWVGNSGYTMEGIIEVPDNLLNTGIITQQDVSAFFIQGYHDGVPIGAWNMRQRTTETTWTLFFDTTNLEFPMGGHFLEQSYQAWNANGEVNDCGPDGFGFNGGNWAQDVCIDNVWIAASSIDPDTPLPVFGMDTEMSCQSVVPLS